MIVQISNRFRINLFIGQSFVLKQVYRTCLRMLRLKNPLQPSHESTP